MELCLDTAARNPELRQAWSFRIRLRAMLDVQEFLGMGFCGVWGPMGLMQEFGVLGFRVWAVLLGRQKGELRGTMGHVVTMLTYVATAFF